MTPKRIFESRPEGWLEGTTTVVETQMGRAYITVNFHEGQPIEVFINLGKGGSNERAAAEAIGRLCSVALQHGLDISLLVRQLRGIASEVPIGFGPNRTMSMPDAVGRVLENLLPPEAARIVRIA